MIGKPQAGAASGLTWFKSSYSTADGPSCVEVATALTTIHVRDSKNIPGPALGFAPGVWADFVAYASAH
ncbi:MULTISPECIES: DUF397 domain-containing protein [unclassified Streptomyces]|uniref:DUF397 domain-containing protein n=1 Tax=unclassified Streptomyces TaxID=2593676 RepID=UPI002DDA5C5A|nr:DUF397 domain-containing protein [Streptomyces sp. NBC_01257]WRZ66741.1 DUF397 domain-containing protein [Streptomyces sp. NBC_01257]WSU60750.1 DUF397 domain-containing protein [Streptomyces sp. NBC_01104]